jgi:hypothetical protein
MAIDMTLLESTLFYSSPPPEPVLRALGRVREVYGFRQISFNEKAGTLHVEYDASHLSSYDVEALLRSAGIKLAHLGPLRTR